MATKKQKSQESFRVVNVGGRPARIVDQTGKVLATSPDGNWWGVVKGVKLTSELDNFITSLAGGNEEQYEVTVEPRIESIGISYTVKVAAKSAEEAVAIARKTARKNIQRELRQVIAESKIIGFGCVNFSVTEAGDEYDRVGYETEESV